jgi:PKD repeat protein
MPDASYGYTAADLAVSFAANFAGGTGYLWNFGDGATSDVANPNHEFAVGGTYHVCLTVTNECGDVQSCKDILVENGASAILVELTIENISCHAAADGALSVLAFGGSGTYTFEWVGPGGFESNGASIHRWRLPVKQHKTMNCSVSTSIFQNDRLIGQRDRNREKKWDVRPNRVVSVARS